MACSFQKLISLISELVRMYNVIENPVGDCRLYEFYEYRNDSYILYIYIYILLYVYRLKTKNKDLVLLPERRERIRKP